MGADMKQSHLMQRRTALRTLSLMLGAVPTIGAATPFIRQSLPDKFDDKAFGHGFTLRSTHVEHSPVKVKVKVLGVGGCGANVVQHMIDHNAQIDKSQRTWWPWRTTDRPRFDSCIQNVEFICANTDAQALRSSTAHNIIHLGTSGMGAAGQPDRGREAAEITEPAIRKAIAGSDMLFIAAGMGGGTGTGAAPVIAHMARGMGILTIGLVTMPFGWEGGRRSTTANNGLAELEAHVDSLFVLPNDKVIEAMDTESMPYEAHLTQRQTTTSERRVDITQDEVFAFTNDVFRRIANGIIDIADKDADERAYCLAQAQQSHDHCYHIKNADRRNECLAQIKGARDRCHAIKDHDSRKACLGSSFKLTSRR